MDTHKVSKRQLDDYVNMKNTQKNMEKLLEQRESVNSNKNIVIFILSIAVLTCLSMHDVEANIYIKFVCNYAYILIIIIFVGVYVDNHLKTEQLYEIKVILGIVFRIAMSLLSTNWLGPMLYDHSLTCRKV